MSRPENADVPIPRGGRPLSKAAVASATFAGLGLFGAAGYMALLIAYYYDNERYDALVRNAFSAALVCLGASLAGLLLGIGVVNSLDMRSGAVRGRPLAIIGIVLGLIALLLSCWLMVSSFNA